MSLLADVPLRTRVAACCGLIAALLGGSALCFAPFVRARASAAAKDRGILLEVRSVGLGWAGIWLKDVDVSVPRLPGVSAHADAVRVGLGLRLNVSSLAVHGAQISLRGDEADLRQQWASYRGERQASAGGSEETRYFADGIDIVWRSKPGLPAQQAWGLSYERDGARERIGLELIRVRGSEINVEVRRPHIVLARLTAADLTRRPGATTRQLESLDADGVEIEVVLPSPALATPGRISREARPPFRPDPGLGVKVRAALTELAALGERSLRESAGLNLERVSLHFRHGNDTLNFGPSLLRVGRLGEQIEVSLSPNAQGSGTPLELKLNLPIATGSVRAEVHGGPVSLRSLGLHEGDFGLSDNQNARLTASFDATLAADGSALAFAGSGAVERVSLHRPELSSLPLTGINLEFEARGTSTLDGAKLVLDDAALSLGQVKIQGQGTLLRGEGITQAHWSGGVPLASCQGSLDALPRGLAPLIASLRMAGTFAAQAQLDYDSQHPSETRVRLNVVNDCHIEQVPPELSPSRFESIWQREVKGPDQQPIEIVSGPGSPDWVPYDAISPFMETAVLVCEDGHFPYHRGFDFEAIQNAIRDNLIKGRFVRGGSTITMQLAKNLYLRREKTLGRKLQEAVLTQLLEQELSKRELMELYLNVIEYGPGIYGIGPAARYYFDKRAADLSLGQALYIASILPNPEHQHFDPDGKVSIGWTRYLQRLMHIAKKVGRINDEQLAVGLSEQVAFHVADSGGAPPAASPAAEEGSDTPSELSP